MMMLLSILCAAAVVLAVLVAMLGPADLEDRPTVEVGVSDRPARFFGADAVRSSAGDDLAVDLMLAQIERHVRLEQVAAENFLDLPSIESLQSGIRPPAVN